MNKGMPRAVSSHRPARTIIVGEGENLHARRCGFQGEAFTVVIEIPAVWAEYLAPRGKIVLLPEKPEVIRSIGANHERVLLRSERCAGGKREVDSVRKGNSGQIQSNIG